MKYVVKCHYCGHSYIVDAKGNKKNFECDKCGGQNGIEQVVERIEDPIVVKKEEDVDWQTIKNFDASKYASEGEYGYTDVPEDDTIFRRMVTVFLLIMSFLLSVVIFKAKQEAETPYERIEREAKERMEERKEEASRSVEAGRAKKTIEKWVQAMQDKDITALYDCYVIPEGSIFDKYDLEEQVKTSDLKTIWGSDVSLESITFEDYLPPNYYSLWDVAILKYTVTFSNGQRKRISLAKTTSGAMKIEPEASFGAENVIIRFAQDSILYIDDKKVGVTRNSVEDESGLTFREYQIPLISQEKHTLEVSTMLGPLSMSFEVTGDNQMIEANGLSVGIDYQNQIEDALMDIWFQVQEAALNYAEPTEFRQYFHSRITDEELADLVKQIRMEQDRQGNYEGAIITAVELSDTYFYAVSEDAFLVSVNVDYETQNVAHMSGTWSGKIAVVSDETGWQIYEKYNNGFFTLVEE